MVEAVEQVDTESQGFKQKFLEDEIIKQKYDPNVFAMFMRGYHNGTLDINQFTFPEL